MLKLNKKIEYALIALKYMGDKPQGELTSAKEICDITHSPFDATSRTLQVMATKGVLRSEQGVRGGYCLTKGLNDISFLELAEMILGPLGVVKCIHTKKGICDLSEMCPISSPMMFLNERVRELFGDISLEEMFKESQVSFDASLNSASQESVLEAKS